MSADNAVAVRALATPVYVASPPALGPGLEFLQWAAHRLETPFGHSLLLGLVMLDFIIVVLEISISLFYECGRDSNGIETVERVLTWASVAILSFFVVELLVKLAVFGLPYFKRVIHIFDALVVLCSLALTLALHGPESELAGLLVILRLWRVMRLVDSVVVINQLSIEDRHRHERGAHEQELGFLRARVAELEALLGHSGLPG